MATDEEIQEDIKKGEHDEDVYEHEGREELTDDAEISPAEEGFMEGYEADGSKSNCQTCGKVIVDNAVEKEVEGKVLRFCSSHCADEYKSD